MVLISGSVLAGIGLTTLFLSLIAVPVVYTIGNELTRQQSHQVVDMTHIEEDPTTNFAPVVWFLQRVLDVESIDTINFSQPIQNQLQESQLVQSYGMIFEPKIKTHQVSDFRVENPDGDNRIAAHDAYTGEIQMRSMHPLMVEYVEVDTV